MPDTITPTRRAADPALLRVSRILKLVAECDEPELAYLESRIQALRSALRAE